MSLAYTALHFASPQGAERWFDQLRTQWVVLRTSIKPDPATGTYIGAANFAVSRGAVVPAHPEDEAEDG